MPHPTKFLAVSVRQPFASLMLAGIKRYEARSWHPTELGWLLVHASSNFGLTKSEIAEEPLIRNAVRKARLADDRAEWPRSAHLGAMEVIKVLTTPPKRPYSRLDALLCGDSPDCLWVIGRTITFPKPIPCKGKLNFFELDRATMTRVRKYLKDDE